MPRNSDQRTGSSTGAYAVVAYNTAADARLWASRYYGPATTAIAPGDSCHAVTRRAGVGFPS